MLREKIKARVLLAIGNNRYDEDCFVDLHGAVKDAQKIHAFFTEGLPPESRFDPNLSELMENPTADQVRKFIDNVRKYLVAGSVFALYFGGHGIVHGGQYYLLCRDAHKSFSKSDGTSYFGSIPLAFMKDFYRECQADVFSIYDACRNSVFTGRGDGDFGNACGFRTATSEKPDSGCKTGERWTLMSCQDGKRASDDGSFMDAVLKSMRAKLDAGLDLRFGSELADDIYTNLGRGDQKPDTQGLGFVLVPGRKTAPFRNEVDVEKIRRETELELKRQHEKALEEARRNAEEARRKADELAKKLAEAEAARNGASHNGGGTDLRHMDDETLFSKWRRGRAKREKAELTPQPTPKPADAPSVVDSLGRSFVRIKHGEFMMGNVLSPDEIVSRWGGEKSWYTDAPQHKVKLTRDYFMCAHQVTRGDFAKFVAATGYKTTAEVEGSAWGFNNSGNWANTDGLNWRNPSFSQTDDHPVVCVSWNDAQKYVEWLNANYRNGLPAGFKYSLPTEAEWEMACRGGTTTEFFWGDDEKDGEGYLNAADETGAPNRKQWNYFFPFKSGYTTTSPVGSFKPNPFGLYDMLGNAWEWCLDWYDSYPTRAVTDPTGPRGGSSRVIRGGGWNDDPRYCRSARRGSDAPVLRSHDVGFRLALKSA